MEKRRPILLRNKRNHSSQRLERRHQILLRNRRKTRIKKKIKNLKTIKRQIRNRRKTRIKKKTLQKRKRERKR